MSTPLRKIAAKAKQDPKARFTSLAHLLTPEFLRDTWRQLNRKGASGIDGETIQEFETNLEERIQDLWLRLRAGQYHAPPVRRVEISKMARNHILSGLRVRSRTVPEVRLVWWPHSAHSNSRPPRVDHTRVEPHFAHAGVSPQRTLIQ